MRKEFNIDYSVHKSVNVCWKLGVLYVNKDISSQNAYSVFVKFVINTENGKMLYDFCDQPLSIKYIATTTKEQ